MIKSILSRLRPKKRGRNAKGSQGESLGEFDNAHLGEHPSTVFAPDELHIEKADVEQVDMTHSSTNASQDERQELAIPRFHQGPLKHTSKTKMQKAYPSAYRYTRIENGWVCQYSSDTPTFAYAQAWKSVIEKTYSPPRSWCLLQDLGRGQYYFVWVKAGIVQIAKQCSQNSIDSIVLHRAQRVYITHETLRPLAPSMDAQIVAPLSADNLKSVALKSTKRLDYHVLLLLIMLMVGGAWLFMPVKQVNKTISVDPYLAYNTQLQQAFSASNAIESAVNLTAYGALAPDGWQFKSVSLQDHAISANFERHPQGLRTVMNEWLDTHPMLKPLTRIALNSAVIDVPLQQGLLHWHGRTLSINALTNNIKDSVVMQGWILDSDSVVSQRGMILQTLTLTKAGATLSELRSLSRLLAPLPVSIKTLNLQFNAKKSVVNTVLSIEFIGVT